MSGSRRGLPSVLIIFNKISESIYFGILQT